MKFFILCLSLSLLLSYYKLKTYSPKEDTNLKNQITLNDVKFIQSLIKSDIFWQKWSAQSIAQSKKNNKLIFLYVGYSGCAPCQQMNNTTLRDKNIVKILNENFIPIVADKDFDVVVGKLYLEAQTALQKMGRWPLTMVLNPNLEPLFAASLVPAQSLEYALSDIHKAWSNKSEELIVRGEKISEFLNTKEDTALSIIDIDQKQKELFEGLKQNIDAEHSGYKMPFKFPLNLEGKYLLRYAYLYQNQDSLKMARSYVNKLLFPKIFDWVNGGFFRYCPDVECMRPQFEKLTVDQALSVDFLSEYFSLTGSPIAKFMIESTIELIKNKFYHSDKGIYLSLDSVGDKSEGDYYTLGLTQVEPEIRKLGLIETWNENLISTSLNGRNLTTRPILKADAIDRSLASEDIKNQSRPLEKIKKISEIIKSNKKNIKYPSLDKQVLTSDNGLMVASLAKAARALQNNNYLDMSRKIAQSITTQNMSLAKTLYHSNQNGHLSEATALDYSYLIYGLIELHQACFESKWLTLASELQKKQIQLFWNSSKKYFKFTVSEDKFPFSKINYIDNLYPSENSLALDNLFRLAKLTDHNQFLEIYTQLKKAFPDSFHDYPWYFTQAYMGLLWDNPGVLKIESCTKNRNPDFSPYTIFKCS